MGYRYDMSKETPPRVCLPKGWRRFKIEDGNETTSKSGNPMFKFIFVDLETVTEHEIYAIATQGKRWFLKQILTACNVEAGQDGVYEWDLPNVLGQIVQGRVEHEQNDWIDRSGNSRSDTRSKIAEIREDNGETKKEKEIDNSEQTPF